MKPDTINPNAQIRDIAEKVKLGNLFHCSLSRTKISKENAEVFVALLADNNSLLSIDLSNGAIGDHESFEVLANWMEKNQSITDVDLSGNILAGLSEKFLIKMLKNNHEITNINLENTHISEDGIGIVNKFIKRNILSEIDKARHVKLDKDGLGKFLEAEVLQNEVFAYSLSGGALKFLEANSKEDVAKMIKEELPKLVEEDSKSKPSSSPSPDKSQEAAAKPAQTKNKDGDCTLL